MAVDFDGAIVEHKYPAIGQEIPFATETLKMFIKKHYRLILWSAREGTFLQEAVDWCKERGVEFWAVDKDYPEEEGTSNNNHFSRKIKADLFINDRNIGGLPDWGQIYHMTHDHKTAEDLIREACSRGQTTEEAKPKKCWWKWWVVLPNNLYTS